MSGSLLMNSGNGNCNLTVHIDLEHPLAKDLDPVK
jgi:hypothetical protein